MNVTLSLPTDVTRRLRAEAAKTGRTLEQYLEEIARQAARGAPVAPATAQDSEPKRATAFTDVGPAARARAVKEIQKVQRKTGRALKASGRTEEDIVGELLKDD